MQLRELDFLAGSLDGFSGDKEVGVSRHKALITTQITL